MSKDNHEPKASAVSRGAVRRKPECKRCEATNRNRIQGRGRRGELAHDSKAHRYGAYGKCGACAPTVRVLTWGDLHRERCASMGRYPASGHTGIPRPKRCDELPAACDESAATTIDATARSAATPGGTAQRSANAVVGGQESGRRRAEQRDARSRTTTLNAPPNPPGKVRRGRHAPSLETRRSNPPRAAASGTRQRQPGAGVETGEGQQGSAGH